MRLSEYAGMALGAVGAGIAVTCSVASAPVAVPVGLTAGFFSGKLGSAIARPLISKCAGSAVRGYLTANHDTGWNPIKWFQKQAQNTGADLAGTAVEVQLGKILNAIDKGERRNDAVNSFVSRQLQTAGGVNVEQAVKDALKSNGGICCPSFARDRIAKWAGQDVVETITGETITPALETTAKLGTVAALYVGAKLMARR